MGDPLDQTSLATISLLEARLIRIEHLLYGSSRAPTTNPPVESVVSSLDGIERRFNYLLSHVRVYAELLQICTPYLPQFDLQSGHTYVL
jgi:hypothetical protein